MRISGWSSDVCSPDLDIAIDEKMRAACLAPFGAGGHRGQDQQGRKQPRYRSKQSHDSPRIFDEPILTATPWIATPKRGIGHLIPWRSEERRVGKEVVSTCRSRWSTSH